ncbi:phosphohydrolase [Comamonas serinivorans]|uniref:Phosphohydrolase n=1 Tax=Comamonas serinivorans TaxID=1082851 RepID=A0A1Y0EJA9_9BURK|nr:response regulator [Comamonas serinivorans]ARU03550.1 phosphohydrolase [Comamonas serinivorans]
MDPQDTPTRATVLFVDDEERVVNLLRMIFRTQYEVLVATSGAQALELLRAHRIDVLVSDQRMPGMTGIELLAQARELSPHTIRLLLTGYTDLAAIVGSVNEGEVFRFLNKPWDHHEIQTTLAAAVAAAHSSRAAFLESARAAEPAASAPAPAEPSTPDILLIDDNPRDLASMEEVARQSYTTHTATSMTEALQILSHHDVGVIVTEARVGEEDTEGFLRVLKQQYPAITTVMLTRSGDADLVIRLINRAQIFRFATKPLRKSVFVLALSAAMKEHMRYRQQPNLLNRLQVEPVVEPDNPSLVNSIAQSVGRWADRFPLLSGKKR